MEALETLLTRRSVRSYTDEKVSREDLDRILEAGKFAASGMGRQSAIMVAVQNPETLKKLEELNCTSAGMEPGHPFYGATTVIVVLADKNIRTHVYDGSLVMGNMMNAAAALGLGSCWIHRARETFETEEGKELLRQWGVEGDYEGIGNLIVGHYDGELPVAKPRKENYVYLDL
ncbi:MAG: nitroreductase [Erysipelotrichaceae bacterium]|nr:nitroreductase [Erysipelotrichaceae bacterium]MBR5048970.1 nitroreductase [Erysipelotrichaceae bacterium]